MPCPEHHRHLELQGYCPGQGAQENKALAYPCNPGFQEANQFHPSPLTAVEANCLFDAYNTVNTLTLILKSVLLTSVYRIAPKILRA